MTKINSDITRIKSKLRKKGYAVDQSASRVLIDRVEEQLGITLPEELTLFYTEIANGCPMIDDFSLKPIEEWEIDKETINNEFPFSEYWVWEDEESDPEDEKLESIYCGSIELINVGGGQAWHIIVNGKEKGQMWFFTGVGIQPCAPKLNFLSWFECWLDGTQNYFQEID